MQPFQIVPPARNIPAQQAPVPAVVSINQADPGITNGVAVLEGTITASVTTVTVSNTVSVTGTVSITGSVSVGNTVSVTGSVVANPTTSTSFATSQVNITASATAIFAAGVGPVYREVRNISASSALYVGGSGVTITTGHQVPGGGVFNMSRNSTALYGVVDTGSITASTIAW